MYTPNHQCNPSLCINLFLFAPNNKQQQAFACATFFSSLFKKAGGRACMTAEDSFFLLAGGRNKFRRQLPDCGNSRNCGNDCRRYEQSTGRSFLLAGGRNKFRRQLPDCGNSRNCDNDCPRYEQSTGRSFLLAGGDILLYTYTYSIPRSVIITR